MTAVFCDVVGSTAMGESVDPEAVKWLLERYFERMRGIVERHGGTVQKFIGDAVVAVFGVPVAHEDDGLRALRAALEMRAALPELGVEARLGVNTGEVVTSGHGTLATGDAVNVAARLQQAAGAGEILVGAETLTLVGDAARVEELSPLSLKGKAEPVAAYRLWAVGEPSGRSHRSVFVGRGGELERLHQAWGRVVETGLCELVTMVGEAGVGKSRLAGELIAGLGARVVAGRCLSYGDGIGYLPVVDVVKQLGARPSDEFAARVLETLLGESDRGTTPDEIAWAFRKLLEQEAPLLVVFDDIQWGEETFLDLVEQAGLLCAGSVLLLCLARPELGDRRPAWPVTLRLEPLGPSEVERLFPASFPVSLRQRIARAAGGNPLFVTEMVAMAADAGGEVAVPPTLRALLGARLDQLEAAERGVLERGAVEGEVFHRGAVQALEPPGVQVAPLLLELVRKELIRPDRPTLPAEDGFRFCHLLIRDAAYEALPKATRAVLHERFADWLDQHGVDLVERDEILGYHLEQSYRYRTELGGPADETRVLGERAASRFVRAGDRALARGDLRATANLLERALAAGLADPRARVRVQAELGNALGETRRISEADAVLVEAHAEATSLGDRGTAALALVYRFSFRYPDFDFGSMRPGLEEAVETFVELGDECGEALARRMLGVAIERKQGRWEAGVAELERALVHADNSGDPAVRRRVIGSLLAGLRSGPAPVVEAIARCEDLLLSSRDDRVLEAVLKRRLGEFYAMAARFDEGLDLVAQSGLVLDELNQLTVSTLYRNSAAYAKELAGDLAGAEQELTARWLGFRTADRGNSRTEMMAANELAFLYCEMARWDEARRFHAYGRDMSWEGYDDAGVLALAVEARLAAHDGEPGRALSRARQAVELAELSDELNRRASMWLVLAEVQRAFGASEDAAVAVTAALSLYEQKGNVAAAVAIRAVWSSAAPERHLDATS